MDQKEESRKRNLRGNEKTLPESGTSISNTVSIGVGGIGGYFGRKPCRSQNDGSGLTVSFIARAAEIRPVDQQMTPDEVRQYLNRLSWFIHDANVLLDRLIESGEPISDASADNLAGLIRDAKTTLATISQAR
jgi:hypothetical protein